LQGQPRKQRQGDNTLLHGRQYKAHGIPRTREDTFKKQGTHRQGRYNTIQESGVGRAGFVEDPVTLWKEVSEEIR
jgi:hypothetical protein